MRESKPVADLLANVPGLRWKIWLKNDDENQGGGIYLFENTEALKSFAEGPIIAKLIPPGHHRRVPKRIRRPPGPLIDHPRPDLTFGPAHNNCSAPKPKGLVIERGL